MTTLILSLLILFGITAACFHRHQRLLKVRAHLMREAMHNREFTFSLPTTGLFAGERALQEALNDLGQEINRLVARNEMESWQRLTRVLTHEIMNATTPIQSISQAYLQDPHLAGSPYQEGLQAIHETAAGLASFVESYRKLTQLEEPVPADLELNTLLTTVRSLFPTLEWRMQLPHPCPLHADAHLLRQVFINLAKNAQEAGARTICIRWDGAIYMSNDGSPIPAEIRREIFIPFFTTKSSGTGIGLALSRQILLMQGMSLSLMPQADKGYHVTFCIRH